MNESATMEKIKQVCEPINKVLKELALPAKLYIIYESLRDKKIEVVFIYQLPYEADPKFVKTMVLLSEDSVINQQRRLVQSIGLTLGDLIEYYFNRSK